MSIRSLGSVPLEDEADVQQVPEAPRWWGRVEELRQYLAEARESNFFEKVDLGDVRKHLEGRFDQMARAVSGGFSDELESAAREWTQDAEALISEAVRIYKTRPTTARTPEGSEGEDEEVYTPRPAEAPQFASRLELSPDWRYPWPAAMGKKPPRKKADPALLGTTTRRVVAAGAVVAGGIYFGRQFFQG